MSGKSNRRALKKLRELNNHSCMVYALVPDSVHFKGKESLVWDVVSLLDYSRVDDYEKLVVGRGLTIEEAVDAAIKSLSEVNQCQE